MCNLIEVVGNCVASGFAGFSGFNDDKSLVKTGFMQKIATIELVQNFVRAKLSKFSPRKHLECENLPILGDLLLRGSSSDKHPVTKCQAT